MPMTRYGCLLRPSHRYLRSLRKLPRGGFAGLGLGDLALCAAKQPAQQVADIGRGVLVAGASSAASRAEQPTQQVADIGRGALALAASSARIASRAEQPTQQVADIGRRALAAAASSARAASSPQQPAQQIADVGGSRRACAARGQACAALRRAARTQNLAEQAAQSTKRVLWRLAGRIGRRWVVSWPLT